VIRGGGFETARSQCLSNVRQSQFSRSRTCIWSVRTSLATGHAVWVRVSMRHVGRSWATKLQATASLVLGTWTCSSGFCLSVMNSAHRYSDDPLNASSILNRDVQSGETQSFDSRWRRGDKATTLPPLSKGFPVNWWTAITWDHGVL
jgi:hypothetical protein